VGVIRLGVGGVCSLLVDVIFLRGRPGPRAAGGGGFGGLWRRRGGRRGRGAGCVFDGGVDEGQTLGNVFGSWLAAFG
jgi:hypothetical protein